MGGTRLQSRHRRPWLKKLRSYAIANNVEPGFDFSPMHLQFLAFLSQFFALSIDAVIHGDMIYSISP
jgi:hypothetical protein